MRWLHTRERAEITAQKASSVSQNCTKHNSEKKYKSTKNFQIVSQNINSGSEWLYIYPGRLIKMKIIIQSILPSLISNRTDSYFALHSFYLYCVVFNSELRVNVINRKCSLILKIPLNLVEGSNVNRLNKLFKFGYFFFQEVGSNLVIFYNTGNL